MKHTIRHFDANDSRTRSFTDARKALRYAASMSNLGYETRFKMAYLEIFEYWTYCVQYWKPMPEEEADNGSTFQAEANEAYREFRRHGGYV